MALTAACSGARKEPPVTRSAPILLPRAVIVQLGRPTEDHDSPYLRVLAALGIPTTVARTSGLPVLAASSSRLVVVVPAATARGLSETERADVIRAVDAGALLLSEEVTPLSEMLGVGRGVDVEAKAIEEVAFPEAPVSWAKPALVTTLSPPAGARVLTVVRPGRQALALSLDRGRGHAIVLAAPLDADGGQGLGRFPFLPQALLRTGVELPFRSPRLAAFFDYGYRSNADVEALAQRWRQAGIAAVHVGAWGFWEPDPKADAYLRRLLAASHREGISVYAWLELPHVSLAFWRNHPRWREKTATLVDAHLDWRYLMNLENADCARQVLVEIEGLLSRFDWDGVNLSELYFDSPIGPQEPAQMTPFNPDVRRAYRAVAGVDALDLLRPSARVFWKRDPAAWARFVDWRVELERALNERFLAALDEIRTRTKPDLGLTLTYVDNLYDPRMREAVGADVIGILPLLERYDFTLIIEDPMTTWSLGPQRYSELAARYAKLTPRIDRLGVDINVVERMPPVFPTAKQTGSELAQLLYHAGKSYDSVMVYGEQTIEDRDLDLVAPALAADTRAELGGDGLWITTRHPLLLRAPHGPQELRVDGRAWPAMTGTDLILPVGRHLVSAEPGAVTRRPHLTQITGLLRDARYTPAGDIEIEYAAEARAFATVDVAPSSALLDGKPLPVFGPQLVLPRGNHRLKLSFGTVGGAASLAGSPVAARDAAPGQ